MPRPARAELLKPHNRRTVAVVVSIFISTNTSTRLLRLDLPKNFVLLCPIFPVIPSSLYLVRSSTGSDFGWRLIRESRITSFTCQLPGATKPAPIPAASPVLVPIPAMSAWKSEALTLLHFARDRIFASRLATAPSVWSGACACVDLPVFVVHLVANWNFA